VEQLTGFFGGRLWCGDAQQRGGVIAMDGTRHSYGAEDGDGAENASKPAQPALR
jgi:hypothetical protein